MDISQELHTIAGYSRDEALRTGCYLISTEHLVLAMLRLEDCRAHSVLRKICPEPGALKKALDSSVQTGRQIPFEDIESIVPGDEVRNCMNLSVIEAGKTGDSTTDSAHLLLSICRNASKACRDTLASFGIRAEAIVSARTGADPVHTPEPRHGTTGAAENFLLQEMHRLAYDKSLSTSKESERS